MIIRAFLRHVVVVALALYAFSGAPLAEPQNRTATASVGADAPKPLVWPDAKTIEDRRKSATNRRLFRVTEPLAFTLIADFKAVNRDRDPKSTRTFPATIEFARDDGTTASIPLRIRTRGHSRRVLCAFAPLRLELPKEQTKGTVFDGHGALKLGTHCRTEFEEYVLREHAAYRIYNLLTPRSFRTRLAKATYVDASSKKVQGIRYGMFIEDDDDVAKRLGGQIVDIPKMTFNRVDMETMTLMALFEYMIGNTDMSLHVQHNVRLTQTPEGMRYPVPYDFDYAGLVDAQYAVPGTGLGLVSVRDRLYRGPCRTPAELEPFFAQIRAIRTDVMALYDNLPDFSKEYRVQAREYLKEFYSAIDKPSAVKRAFIDGCKGRPYM